MDPHDTDGSAEDPSTERDDATAPTPRFPPPPGPPPAAAAGTPDGSWIPPDAGAATARRAEWDGVEVEVEDADGPPIPPPVRRRRRRRRSLLAAAVLLVVGVPVGFAVATTFGAEDAPFAFGGDPVDDETDEDGPDTRDGGDRADTDEDADGDALEPLDLEALSGADAVYGRLLVDIDASERIMIAFQDELATVFSVPAESPDALIEELQDIGAAGRDDLLEVRDRLDDELDVDGAEEVRDRYVAHLDSWADYMAAVAEDPGVLGGEGTGAGFTVVINATADAFARTLEEELPDTADASVRAYASDLLDRGFRGGSDAQV